MDIGIIYQNLLLLDLQWLKIYNYKWTKSHFSTHLTNRWDVLRRTPLSGSTWQHSQSVPALPTWVLLLVTFLALEKIWAFGLTKPRLITSGTPPVTLHGRPQLPSSRFDSKSVVQYAYKFNFRTGLWFIIDSSFNVSDIKFDRLGNMFLLDGKGRISSNSNKNIVIQ